VIEALRRLFARPAPAGKALGRWGERHAERHLKRRGYRLVARNFQVGPGEADLVFDDPKSNALVIVEVKTRVGTTEPGAFRPEANIDGAKRRKLVQVARAAASRLNAKDRLLRIDVIAVEWKSRGQHTVRHYENAVTGNT